VVGLLDAIVPAMTTCGLDRAIHLTITGIAAGLRNMV
jgi:phosphoenolpyruvate carboxylase